MHFLIYRLKIALKTHLPNSADLVNDALRSNSPAKIQSTLEVILNKQNKLNIALEKAQKKRNRALATWRYHENKKHSNSELHPSLYRFPIHHHYNRYSESELNILRTTWGRTQAELDELIDKNDKHRQLINLLAAWTPDKHNPLSK